MTSELSANARVECESAEVAGRDPERAPVSLALVPHHGVEATRVLIVVPTLDEAAHIEAVLHSLLSQPPRQAKVLLAVVDGGSTDGTVEIVQRIASHCEGVLLLHNPARIQSAAVNLAARAFGPSVDVLVRCDAHSSYPPRFCERLLETLQARDADAVVVPIDSVGQSALQSVVAWVSNSVMGTGGSAHRAGTRSGFVDHGHHAAFRMDSFRRCGGYDETFSHNEDAELDCRQRALGGRIYLDATVRVGYRPRATLAGLWRQYFRYGVGRARTLQRHPHSIRARQLIVPLNLLLIIGSVLLTPISIAWLAWPAAYLFALISGSIFIALERRSLLGMIAAPIAALMHSAWGTGLLWGLAVRRERAWNPVTASALWPAKETPETPRKLQAILVDPSLFTAPYDGALTEGLLAAGVIPAWAVRPIRRGDRQELPAEYVDAFFYRRVDGVIGLPGACRTLAKGFAHLWGLWGLVRRVRVQRPDVVHFQWLVLPLFDALAIAAIRRTCPVVVTVHDTVAFNGDRLSTLQSAATTLPLRLADRLIVHTRAGRDVLVKRGLSSTKIAVIAHGPLSLRVLLDTAARPRAEAPVTFVLFGEMKRYKGIDVLVDALALLPELLLAQSRFIIAGRPRMDIEPILARIRALGLGKHVEVWPRRLSEREMAELFAAADCFVFPYRQIDASGVYYLVKGLGRWIIASRIGIFAEELGSGDRATLVPSEDRAALTEAIARTIAERPVPRSRTTDTDWMDIGAMTRRLYLQAMAKEGVP